METSASFEARYAPPFYPTTVHGRTRVSDPPCQDPPRKVVDHGVQVGAGPVEQANDGGVDVSQLVGSRRAKAHLGLRRVHAEPGRRQPNFRTRRYQVEGEAQTLLSRCASTARVPIGTCR